MMIRTNYAGALRQFGSDHGPDTRETRDRGWNMEQRRKEPIYTS